MGTTQETLILIFTQTPHVPGADLHPALALSNRIKAAHIKPRRPIFKYLFIIYKYDVTQPGKLYYILSSFNPVISRLTCQRRIAMGLSYEASDDRTALIFE